MIIDSFLFHDEFDMLDIRIAINKGYVDKWIVCEANKTMSGKPKSFALTEAIDRYEWLGDRLHVVQFNVPEEWNNWQIENQQRVAIKQALADCAPDDIIIHSDLDEIIDPSKFNKIVEYMDEHNRPVACPMEMYNYKFDQRAMRKWTGPVVARRRMFEDPCKLYKGVNAGDPNNPQKKKMREHCVGYPEHAGWHWCWIGNDERIRTKAEAAIETQFRDTSTMLDHFHKLDLTMAINHKAGTVHVPEPDYPAPIMEILKRYPAYWT